MRAYQVLGALFCALASTSGTAHALSKETAESLAAIGDFADRICQTVPIESKTSEIALSASASADLATLIKKLANLGISGAAKYDNRASMNVLQAELARVLKETRDCRIRVWDDLKNKFQMGAESSANKPVGPPVVKLDPFADMRGAHYWQKDSGTFDTKLTDCLGEYSIAQAVAFGRAGTALGELTGQYASTIQWKYTYTGPQVIVAMSPMELEIAKYPRRNCLVGGSNPRLVEETYTSVLVIRPFSGGLVYDETLLSRSEGYPVALRTMQTQHSGTAEFLGGNKYFKLDNKSAFTFGTEK